VKMIKREKIGFIGIGKLGLDCAEVMAERHEVRGYDIVPRTSDTVKVCDIAELVRESDWIFIAVPTPHTEGYDGSVPSSHMPPKDFGHDAVIDAINKINTHATTTKRVVLISTVLPGTTRKHFVSLLDNKHLFLYNPYLIAMGSVKWDMANPEMVIIGTEDGSLTGVAGELIDLYKTIMQNDPRYEVGTWDECEAIKIFYNTFISAKVGLVNMIQDFAMRIGNINVDVVTNALARSTMRIMGPKYMTAGMGDAGACHPRDNIALRWLAQEYDLGYDLFDTVMHAREIQAKNLAKFLLETSVANGNLPVVIHGKAYKPDVPYCIGSYSTLVGFYLNEMGVTVKYLDPLADDSTDVVQLVEAPHVVLWAHDRQITYEYTGEQTKTQPYCEIPSGSIIVDPWRKLNSTSTVRVIHYGNTRT
jgi:UDPglucose 6-dehydrogenase